MTTVVSDTSPVNYLVLVGAIDVLPRLFEVVIIPPGVLRELQQLSTPKIVYEWANQLPGWVRVQQPSRIDRTLDLGAGETEAISLAVELSAEAILIDEKLGRKAAQERGLFPIGTLNILDAADLRGYLDLEEAVERLRRTNFHIAESILNQLIERVRARKLR